MSGDMENWFARMTERALAQHANEVSGGQHDDECEWRINFRMCHCHRRDRLAKGVVEAPAMIFMSPQCDGCGHTANHTGDGWECGRCKVYFGDCYDEPGYWQDEYAATDAELRAQSSAAAESVGGSR